MQKIFKEKTQEIICDCIENNFSSATHKINLFGKKYGNEMMLSLTVIVSAALNEDMKISLAHMFWNRQAGFHNVKV